MLHEDDVLYFHLKIDIWATLSSCCILLAFQRFSFRGISTLETLVLKILLRSLRCAPPFSWSVWISWWNAFASSIFFFWLLPLAFQRSYSRCLVLVCYLHIVPLCTMDSLCFTLVYYPPYDPSLALGLCRFMSISLFE